MWCEDIGPQPQPEHVYQVHAEADVGNLPDQPVTLSGLVDSGEQKECSESVHHAVEGAEAPANLNGSPVLDGPRDHLDIETEDRGCQSGGKRNQADEAALGFGPFQMSLDIVRQHQISRVPRKVEQQIISVPEALSPEVSEPSVDIWDTCAECPQSNEQEFLSCGSDAQPWGDERDEKVQADKRIHEP